MNMYRIAVKLRNISIASAVLVLSSFTMLAAGSMTFADDGPCTAPGSDQNGTHAPVGADAATFTYQCSGPYAGEWTNPYYVYSPATGARTALYSPDYRYDCSTNSWTMTSWNYNPGSGKFVSSRVAPTTAPNLPTGCPSPAPPTPSTGPAGDPATSSTPGSSGSTVANTGPSSGNSADNSVTTNGAITNNTGVSMGNTISSTATTGDTNVVGNTTGGSAGSGDAQSVANVANLLQTTSNVFGPDTAVFTADINGTVNGDFLFDPSAILASGSNSNNSTSNSLQVNTAAANTTDASINNNIDVGATSGNATVAGNTSGGNATSGNADAVVNLMNLINSTVAAGQSFVGTININGDLNGDILLPQDVLDQLLASAGPSSNNSATTNLSSTATVNNNVTESATNNIHSTATSGTASVTGNTSAGSATSGNSGTNVTLLNLTGSNTVGKNDLLVFVNVLGTWVGMIMNAPSGSTAAEIGGGITDTGPSSNNVTANNLASSSSVDNNVNLGITNNVNVHAQSGDATVAHNTSGGNAQTGDANTAVNILNLMGSNLNLSNWFGVLFINVFGMWNGSFGVNTSAGDPVVSKPGRPTNNPVQAATQRGMLNTFHRLAGFTPHNAGATSNSPAAPAGSSTGSDFKTAAVLGTDTALDKVAAASSTHPTPDNKSHASFFLPTVGFGLACLILLASERDRLFGHKK